MTYYDKNALKLSHEYIAANVTNGDTVVDATCGRGRDTLLLSRLVGNDGKVISFDIQKVALEEASELIKKEGLTNVTLINDSHHNLKNYVSSAKCVVFNFGFLPGGDHSIFSKPETSIPAIDAALDIITEDGFVAICSYYGGPNGYEERDAILSHLSKLDNKKYTVLCHNYLNRPNDPPIFIVVEKNH